MPLDNRVIIASAGSGKTTTIVDDACGDTARRAAMITYTNNDRLAVLTCVIIAVVLPMALLRKLDGESVGEQEDDKQEPTPPPE